LTFAKPPSIRSLCTQPLLMVLLSLGIMHFQNTAWQAIVPLYGYTSSLSCSSYPLVLFLFCIPVHSSHCIWFLSQKSKTEGWGWVWTISVRTACLLHACNI
jgi:hypothetical protein